MEERRRIGRRRFLNYSTLLYQTILTISFMLCLLLSLSTELTSYYPVKIAAQITSEDFLTYENATLGIKIQYPLGWHILSSNNSLVRFVSPQENDSDTFLEELRIAASPISHCGNISLAELTNRIATDHIKNGVDIRQNESKTKNGNIANNLVYTFIDPQYGMLKAQDLLTIKEGKLYVIQYQADVLQYSNYLPLVQKMINSFKVLNANGSPKVLNNDGENQTNKFLTYTNDNYGISMIYPADWSKEEIDTTPRNYDVEVVQFWSPQSCAPGKYNVKFSVMIRMYSDGNTPKNVDEELEYVTDRGYIYSTNFKVVESNTNTSIADYPAYKIVWTETIDDTTIKVMEKGIIIGGDVYVVEYRAEPERYSIFLPIVQQMIDSLKIK